MSFYCKECETSHAVDSRDVLGYCTENPENDFLNYNPNTVEEIEVVETSPLFIPQEVEVPEFTVTHGCGHSQQQAHDVQKGFCDRCETQIAKFNHSGPYGLYY